MALVKYIKTFEEGIDSIGIDNWKFDSVENLYKITVPFSYHEIENPTDAEVWKRTSSNSLEKVDVQLLRINDFTYDVEIGVEDATQLFRGKVVII